MANDIQPRERVVGVRGAFATILIGLMLSVAPGVSAAAELYGLIGKMTTVPGQRDAFIAILMEGINDMPGCLSYVVAKDANDPNAIWITEVWDSKASHDASLSLPAVKAAIAKGRPLITSMGDGAITLPVAMAKVQTPAAHSTSVK